MRLSRFIAVALSFAVLAVACGSTTTTVEPDSTSTVGEAADAVEADQTGDGATLAAPITILNQGGRLEGHTPRGFMGMGTGLFAGDELNPNFPQDDGVQIWLSFELPSDVTAVAGATLRSDFLTVRGNPFESLGNLQAAPVRYEAFSPAVQPLEPVGPTVTCPAPTDSTFTCEIGAAVNAEIDAGRDLFQVRLRFEGTSDPDGEQDMALFFITDSNTNEPGIFELALR